MLKARKKKLPLIQYLYRGQSLAGALAPYESHVFTANTTVHFFFALLQKPNFRKMTFVQVTMVIGHLSGQSIVEDSSVPEFTSEFLIPVMVAYWGIFH